MAIPDFFSHITTRNSSMNTSTDSILDSIVDSIKTEAENPFSEIPYSPICLDIKTENVPIEFELRDEDNPAVNLNNKFNMDPIDKEIHLTHMDDKETNKCHQ